MQLNKEGSVRAAKATQKSASHQFLANRNENTKFFISGSLCPIPLCKASVERLNWCSKVTVEQRKKNRRKAVCEQQRPWAEQQTLRPGGLRLDFDADPPLIAAFNRVCKALSKTFYRRVAP